jgi:hypothetical protein
LHIDVKDQFGREISLKLNCETRWCSLYDMVERFLKLKTCVTLALLELHPNISFGELEWQLLQNIPSAFKFLNSERRGSPARREFINSRTQPEVWSKKKLDQQMNKLSN